MKRLIEWIHWLKDWTLAWAATPIAPWALFANAFLGSSCFPLPPDLMLITMCIATPHLSLFYALICSVASTLGGMMGYLIGIKGGKPILRKFVSEERIHQVHSYFEKYEEWAIGIAGFTPLPYKVFAISAGVFYINFWKFVIVTIISRSARFFILAGLLMVFGESIKYYIDHYFDKLSILFVILLVGGFYIMKFIKIPGKTNEDSENKETSKDMIISAEVPESPEAV